MKVILLEDVKKLGKKGQIVEVAEGYGNNFLIRRGLAAPGTNSNINNAKQKIAAKKHKKQVAKDEAVILASQLEKVEVNCPIQVGEEGRVFGSVTAKDISEAIQAKYKVDVDKKKIEVKSPLKVLGTYNVIIRVHPEITATIKVHVTEAK